MGCSEKGAWWFSGEEKVTRDMICSGRGEYYPKQPRGGRQHVAGLASRKRFNALWAGATIANRYELNCKSGREWEVR